MEEEFAVEIDALVTSLAQEYARYLANTTDIAQEAFDLDVQFMTELINGVFTNTELDGASLAEQFPDASEEMIAEAVKNIEGMYQWWGYNFTASGHSS